MRRLLIGAVLLALSVSLQATVLVPIEFRELVNTAPVIVAGRVADVRAEWVDGRRSIETFVTVTAGEYLKGNLGDTLTLRGERRREAAAEGDVTLRVERPAGSFERSFILGAPVRTDAVKAVYRDGVLEIQVPKADHARSLDIEVQAG